MKRLFWLPLIFLPLLLFFLLWTPPTAVQGSQFDGRLFDRQVVRAYFGSPDKVAEVAQWRVPWGVNLREGYLEIDVSPEEMAQLEAWGFRLEVDEALTDLLYRPARPLANQPNDTIPGYACYRTLVGTQNTAVDIATNYPNLAELIDIGDSWAKTQNVNNGHDLTVLRLTNQAIPGPKPPIFIISSIHAREYTPAELNTRFAEYLVQNYGTDPDVTWLLDYYDFHLLLQANPDGREQAQNGLLWRKNYNQNFCPGNFNSGFRPGIDLNRNFAFEWGSHGGSSGSACSEVFRGPFAGSEPETDAIQNYAQAIFPNQRSGGLSTPAPVTATGMFLDVHSYSELVLWPWGFPGTTGNDTAYRTLGRKLAYFNDYLPTQAVNLYPTDGTTIDFVYGERGVASFTFELGTAFFQNCTTFEDTILPDNLEAFLYMSKAARAPYLLPAGPDVLDLTATAVDTTRQQVTLTAVLNDRRFNNDNGVEPTQAISTAVVYHAQPHWVSETLPIATFTPDDGNFNSPIETATAVVDVSGWTPGQHTLFVQGQDSMGNWGVDTAVFVNVPVPIEPITASFSSSSPVFWGETMVFTSTSAGEIMTHTWDFGDGSPLNFSVNPTHTYGLTGTFTVTLTVANSVTMDTAVQEVTVLTPPPPPTLTASFTSSSPIFLGETMVFTSTSAGDILTHTWNLGDGSPLSFSVNPTHTYGVTGTFAVTLTVANSVTMDTAVGQVTVLPEIITPVTIYRYLLPLLISSP